MARDAGILRLFHAKQGAVMCGWLLLCKVFSTDVDRYGERSCVRPVGAVYITAGLDEVRVPAP